VGKQIFFIRYSQTFAKIFFIRQILKSQKYHHNIIWNSAGMLNRRRVADDWQIKPSNGALLKTHYSISESDI
jgi:hypothetical protein